jgi:hypothetical protein
LGLEALNKAKVFTLIDEPDLEERYSLSLLLVHTGVNWGDEDELIVGYGRSGQRQLEANVLGYGDYPLS